MTRDEALHAALAPCQRARDFSRSSTILFKQRDRGAAAFLAAAVRRGGGIR